MHPMKLTELLSLPAVSNALNKLDGATLDEPDHVAMCVAVLAAAIVDVLEERGIAADDEECALALRLLTALFHEVKREAG